MTTRPKVADSIVHRHPCDCTNASRPLSEGEGSEHRFDVDGQPFPYHVTEEGPKFTRIGDDLYRVDVTIFPTVCRRDAHKGIAKIVSVMVSEATGAGALMIGSEVFPWVISEDGFTVKAARKSLVTVQLGFIAKSLDTDGPVSDERSSDDDA